MPSFPEFVRLFQQATEGMRQKDVGERIGVTQSYAGQLIRGDANPSRELIERIVEEFPDTPRETWLLSAGHGPKGTHVDPIEAAAMRAAELTAEKLQDPDHLAEALLRVVERDPKELTYEADLEEVDVRGYRGAENLSPRDAETLNHIIRHLISEKRRGQGRE